MERFGWLRRYVSPVFLALLVASFILWYIAKLNYTYTTEQPFTVNVDGERFKTDRHYLPPYPASSRNRRFGKIP